MLTNDFADFLTTVYELLSSTHTFQHTVFVAYLYKEILIILNKNEWGQSRRNELRFKNTFINTYFQHNLLICLYFVDSYSYM